MNESIFTKIKHQMKEKECSKYNVYRKISALDISGNLIKLIQLFCNRRPGVALAMHHRLQWFIHLRAQRL